MKITPVLIVHRIEPSLEFWVDRMGFEKTVDVPEEGGIGFAILVGGGAELMFQTVASVRADVAEFAPVGDPPPTNLFIEVDDFADTLRRLEGYPVALAERVTFYGMREIGVREPGGHLVIFAAKS